MIVKEGDIQEMNLSDTDQYAIQSEE